MKMFKDTTGKDWTIEINVDAFRRVKSALDIDLMKLLSDNDFVETLAGDPVMLCDVLYVVCSKQAEADGVTSEHFGQRLGGDTLDHATTALLEDFVDFFPSRKRAVLRLALAKMKGVEAQVLKMAEEKIESLDLLALMLKKSDPSRSASPTDESAVSAAESAA